MSGAPDVRITTENIRPLVGELGAMTPAMRSELRRGFRAAGGKALARAKASASWSSRIPGAISVRPLTGARSAGVFLRVNAAKAPHARAYEAIGSAGVGGAARFFRHRVFGQDVWVNEPTRPFMVPAVQASRDDAQHAALDAIQAAARVGRFH